MLGDGLLKQYKAEGRSRAHGRCELCRSLLGDEVGWVGAFGEDRVEGIVAEVGEDPVVAFGGGVAGFVVVGGDDG